MVRGCGTSRKSRCGLMPMSSGSARRRPRSIVWPTRCCRSAPWGWRREGSRRAGGVSRGAPGTGAPPGGLARELWAELMTLKGDAGARQVLDHRPEWADTVPSPDRLDDIDTPEDYAKIVKLFPRPNPTPRA